MHGWRRSAAALVGLLGLLVITGCSPTVASTGQRLTDPAQPLETALAKLKKDNNAGIQNNTITVSSETACFYRKAPDSKGITDQAFCGPIRRLGLPIERVWDSYHLIFTSKDGNAVATVGSHTAQGIAVDTDLLVSPSGGKPASAADLPAPKAPQTSIANRAVALAADAAPADLAFRSPSHPARLITPAATVKVTGVAEPKQVPQALVAGQHDPAGKAPYYLPAAGQQLYAYQLQISPPREATVPVASTFRAESNDPATELGLRVAGNRLLPIADQTGSTASTTTLTVPCAGSGSAPYPCRPRTTRIVVLMTVPAAGGLSLSATTAGAGQAVDLVSGAVTSTVSTVEYQRTKLTSRIDRRLRTDPYQVRLTIPQPADSTATKEKKTDSTASKDTRPKAITASARWSMTIDSVGLSAFEPSVGWAPKGQAWMIMSTSRYHRKDDGAVFTDRRASSLSVTVDGTAHPVKEPTDADLAAHLDDNVTWLIAVPDDATTATVALRPIGTVSADGASTTFAADPAATLDIDLPH